jgi:hypothetical protein
MKVILISLILLMSRNSVGSDIQYKDLIRDGNFSSQTSDHYKAIRLFRFVGEKAPNILVELGIARYLHSLNVVGNDRAVLDVCQELSKSVSKKFSPRLQYNCARFLINGKYSSMAAGFTRKVPTDSKLYPFALVIEGAALMRDSNGGECTKRLHAGLLERFQKEGIGDLYHLTRARCHIVSQLFDDAIGEYQKVGQESPHYFESLNEIGWVFFKTRNLERATEVFNIISSVHRSIGNEAGKGVSDRSYFEARYLRSYIDIIKKGAKNQTQKFEELKIAAEKKHKEEEFFQKKVVGKLQSEIQKNSAKWLDLKSASASVVEFLDFSKTWVQESIHFELERSVELTMSLTKEIERISKLDFDDKSNFVSQLQRLKMASDQELEKRIAQVVDESSRTIRSIQIKAEMGKLEMEWVNRNEGVRDANELLKGYQESVKSVEDYLGG